ncbi:MAG TPA: hypothetical protein VMU54_24740 [Planctomycetota bacterium]|nr:hypothetical protein [Planctomycetota bacterium]
MRGLEWASLRFHGMLSPWAAGVLLLAAAIGIFVLYFKERGSAGAPRRILMALFRVAVVGVALFFLTRPVLVTETRGERPREIILLIDNSLSMTQRDQRLSVADRLRVALAENRIPPDAKIDDAAEAGELPQGLPEDPSRSAMVRAVLSNPRLKLLEGLQKQGPVRVEFFGQRVRALGEEERNPRTPPVALAERIKAEMKSEDARTALADAILEVLSKAEGDPPSAILAMTDGQDNASKESLDEAARECALRHVPLHVYGVGSSETVNLEMKDLIVPDTLFFDDTVSALIRWKSHGVKQGSAELTLLLGSEVVARKEVAVQEGEDFRDELTFTPRKTGAGLDKAELKAVIRFKGIEAYTDDNEVKKTVTLVDRKVKILYVEGTPRWEYKFLQTSLLRDRRVAATFFLAEADKRTLASGTPYLPSFPATRAELFAFDVLIFGDVPAAVVGTDRIAWIRDFVREGGSLVFIAGRQHAPSEYGTTPLAEVLPVEFPQARFESSTLERQQVYVPQLTRAGERSEMLALADTPDENVRAWQTLPGFFWHYPANRLRPGAAALLVHPRHSAGEPSVPIMAAQYYGKGHVLYLGTDETWRWRANGGEKRFSRFWGQVIYQMGLPHLIGTPKRVQLALERRENTLGRPSYVYARVFDAEYRPFVGEKVTGRIEAVDAKAGEERRRTLTLDPVPGLAGEFRALLPHDAVGRFRIQVDEPAGAWLEYKVNLPPQHELEVRSMDTEGLRAVAQAGGGKFCREEDLLSLVAGLKPQTATFTIRHEMLLWNAPMLILFVGLITGEWILRKLSNLS